MPVTDKLAELMEDFARFGGAIPSGWLVPHTTDIHTFTDDDFRRNWRRIQSIYKKAKPWERKSLDYLYTLTARIYAEILQEETVSVPEKAKKPKGKQQVVYYQLPKKWHIAGLTPTEAIILAFLRDRAEFKRYQPYYAQYEVYISDQFGFSRRTYQRGLDRLTELGYIEQRKWSDTAQQFISKDELAPDDRGRYRWTQIAFNKNKYDELATIGGHDNEFNNT